MKQAIVRKGFVIAEDIPAPVVSDGSVLIKVIYSCISAGTEKAGVISSGTPLIKRILKQPEKVIKTLKLAKSEGISRVYKQVVGEIQAGKPIGYSLSGVVVGVGKGIQQFKTGDRVAAAGGGYANHAEFVDVPVNLVVKIPEDLGFMEASTVTLGAIALHGVRRADLALGEYCAVYGTGIIGLLTVQLLVSSGIRVIALDLDDNRLQLAKKFGAELTINTSNTDPVKAVENFTGGSGSDAVIFTASTSSSEPLSQSFKMCRRKGKVILVGVSGMEVNRNDIYPKEIDLIISTSYGPGRYDKNYEEKGIDYPYPYVRWTENRNLAEYLRLVKAGSVDINPMINKVYPIDQVKDAFQALGKDTPPSLLTLLDYGMAEINLLKEELPRSTRIEINKKSISKDVFHVALIGAGNFATSMHLPILSKLKNKFTLHAVTDKIGNVAKSVAEQYKAVYATSNPEDVFQDDHIDVVLICTRHDSHGDLVLHALKNGKHVFVEKPLASNPDQLSEIENYYKLDTPEDKPVLMVGFNRRFSRYAAEIKTSIAGHISPLFLHYRMNAGYLPPDHWVYETGGRIIGEACHIIDLMTFLVGKPLSSFTYDSLEPETGKFSSSDNKSIILKYDDGSVATIEYFSLGNMKFPKENMEIHFDEKTILLSDYQQLKGYGVTVNEIKTDKPDKGHYEEWLAFYNCIKTPGAHWPIPLHEMIETTRLTHMIQ